MADGRPLVVDVDGTLLRTDLLVESFFALMAQAPLRGLAALAALARGRAALKAAVAAGTALDVASLPQNEELVAWLREERAAGRAIYLASAADRRLVAALAAELGLFDGVLASDGTTNLKGAAKAAALCARFGRSGFDYAGDARADLPVWEAAAGVVVVNAAPGLVEEVRRLHPGARVIAPRGTGWRQRLRALRPHQWLKNLLLVLPAFAAHRFEGAAGLACLAAFVSFSLCASSVYLLNDLLDLAADRAHPTKRRRPFAAGEVPLAQGVGLFVVALLAAMAVAAWLPLAFIAVLAGYYVLTVAYSFRLKREPVVDVLTLACLYGIRLLAGAVAVAVVISPWLLAFSGFFFLFLALVKRSTEVIDRREREAGDPPGRGYRLADLPILQTMATTAGYVSILVFVLYANSPETAALYRSPHRLWLIAVVLLYWVSRVMLLTERGEMHDDPVLFAARDPASLWCVGGMAAVVLASI